MSFTVRFRPEKRSWRGAAPTPLGIAAAECGILLEQPCGGKAICGKCRVRALDGVPASDADRRVLGRVEADAGWRLACAVVVDGDATLEVPATTRTTAHKSFGDDGLFRDGIEAALPGGRWGIALDVGSTTLAAALVALDTGVVAASASTLNPQTHYGGDVVSRIAFARERAEGGAVLHRVLASACDALVGECLSAEGVGRDELAGVAVVGNPTMTHTLLGLDLAGLGVAPFQGTRYEVWNGTARELGLQLADDVAAYILPGVRSHVGADAVAAIVATAMDRVDAPTLLIDLGTNSEVVLATPDGILCTSASAGPAFEGANIHHGMRAVPGAIERLRVARGGELRIDTVAADTPVGLCGSGLIDAAAELVRAGVIEPSGRLRSARELAWLPGPLRERVVDAPDGGRAVRLAGTTERPVLLTARDVRELQLVKGSIAAAVRLLLDHAGLAEHDIGEVLVAGAFGSHLHVASARAIGLVPHLSSDRVRPVGNAAGAGARLALVDRRARERAERVATDATFIELADRPDYQAAFVEALPFPDPFAFHAAPPPGKAQGKTARQASTPGQPPTEGQPPTPGQASTRGQEES